MSYDADQSESGDLRTVELSTQPLLKVGSVDSVVDIVNGKQNNCNYQQNDEQQPLLSMLSDRIPNTACINAVEVNSSQTQQANHSDIASQKLTVDTTVVNLVKSDSDYNTIDDQKSMFTIQSRQKSSESQKDVNVVKSRTASNLSTATTLATDSDKIQKKTKNVSKQKKLSRKLRRAKWGISLFHDLKVDSAKDMWFDEPRPWLEHGCCYRRNKDNGIDDIKSQIANFKKQQHYHNRNCCSKFFHRVSNAIHDFFKSNRYSLIYLTRGLGLLIYISAGWNTYQYPCWDYQYVSTFGPLTHLNVWLGSIYLLFLISRKGRILAQIDSLSNVSMKERVNKLTKSQSDSATYNLEKVYSVRPDDNFNAASEDSTVVNLKIIPNTKTELRSESDTFADDESSSSHSESDTTSDTSSEFTLSKYRYNNSYNRSSSSSIQKILFHAHNHQSHLHVIAKELYIILCIGICIIFWLAMDDTDARQPLMSRVSTQIRRAGGGPSGLLGQIRLVERSEDTFTRKYRLTYEDILELEKLEDIGRDFDEYYKSSEPSGSVQSQRQQSQSSQQSNSECPVLLPFQQFDLNYFTSNTNTESSDTTVEPTTTINFFNQIFKTDYDRRKIQAELDKLDIINNLDGVNFRNLKKQKRKEASDYFEKFYYDKNLELSGHINQFHLFSGLDRRTVPLVQHAETYPLARKLVEHSRSLNKIRSVDNLLKHGVILFPVLCELILVQHKWNLHRLVFVWLALVLYGVWNILWTVGSGVPVYEQLDWLGNCGIALVCSLVMVLVFTLIYLGLWSIEKIDVGKIYGVFERIFNGRSGGNKSKTKTIGGKTNLNGVRRGGNVKNTNDSVVKD